MSGRNGSAERERALVEAVGRFVESTTPEGPILVVGDPSPAVAGRFRGAGLEVVRWHRSTEAAWLPVGSWPTVAVRLPRAKDELEMLVHAAASRLAPGGELLVYGANDEGIKSAGALIEPLFGPVETATVKSRCRVLRSPRPDEWPLRLSAELRDWKSVTRIELGGEARSWVSYPGVFSHGRLDAGSRLLLENVGPPPDGSSLLDYGCGSGVLAAGLLGDQTAGGADVDVHLLDPDRIALEAARENVPGARIHAGAGLGAVGDLRFELIASNPPYHRGKVEDLGVVEELIRGAPMHLEPGGSLVMVVQRRLPVEALMHEEFDQVEIVAEDETYRVWMGTGSRTGV